MATKEKKIVSRAAGVAVALPDQPDARQTTFEVFRRWGFLQATLDPLGQFLPGEAFPVAVPDGPDAVEAR